MINNDIIYAVLTIYRDRQILLEIENLGSKIYDPMDK